MNIDCPDFTPNLPNAGKHFRTEVGVAHPVQAGILLRTDSLNSRNKETEALSGEDLRHKSALFFWPGRGPFSFRQDEKKMVGAYPRTGMPVQNPAPWNGAKIHRAYWVRKEHINGLF